MCTERVVLDNLYEPSLTLDTPASMAENIKEEEEVHNAPVVSRYFAVKKAENDNEYPKLEVNNPSIEYEDVKTEHAARSEVKGGVAEQSRNEEQETTHQKGEQVGTSGSGAGE
jgi:hypothetical protein